VSMGIFGVAGYYLDQWLGTLPTFTVALLLIGIYLSFRVFIKDVLKRGRVRMGNELTLSVNSFYWSFVVTAYCGYCAGI